MRKALKWTGISLLAGLLLLAALVLHTVYFRPLSLNLFYHKVFLQFVFRDPEMLSSMRLLAPLGLRYGNDRLTPMGPERELEDMRILKRNLADLRGYDSASLEGEEKLSWQVLEWFLADIADGERFMYHNYPVNQMFGVQSNLPTFMATQHTVESIGEAEDYIARLNGFGAKFDGLVKSLELREAKGIIPPRFVVQKVLREMRAFIGLPAEENILYTSFADKLEALELREPVRESLLRRAAGAIEREVYPAYKVLISFFDRLRSVATTNHGVWALPDGEAFYAYQIRHHTTTDMDADEIHRVGKSEVARIEAAMDRILCAQELCEGGVGERLARLGEDPRYLYPADAHQEVLADYQSLIDEIAERLPEWFGTLPRAAVRVERIPEFKQATAPGAYYNGPSRDGSRPGIFYANLRDVGSITRWGMPTLAYHEAIPGHHLQIAIAMELEGVPMFRNYLPFTAFSEGWALYAERLAAEMGMLEDPLADLGRLQAEMFRAVRLVVDTGLHAKRWSRQRAIRYMREKTGMPETEVVAEIERYLVNPGQALAYKVGMLKLLELRQRAEAALGEAFDIRAFHDVILTHGALPLTLVEANVEAWIASRAGRE